MSWETDGRFGIASIGDERRKGFAMMRDAVKGLIAFHADPSSLPLGFDEQLTTNEDFTIPEGDFEAVKMGADQKQ